MTIFYFYAIISKLNLDYADYKTIKGVLVIYSINKDKNISDIITIMEKLNNITDNDADIIFGTEIDNNLKIEECKFNILITGLEII